MRTSYRNETNALESLLGDLNRCAGERDIDELMRQPQYSLARSDAYDFGAGDDDEDVLAGVTLSALCAVPMESRFQIGLECFAKYYVDGLFYRARITDKSDRSYVVEFVEYGNIQDTYEADILEEQEALAYVAAEDPSQGGANVQCLDCGHWSSATLTYCDECGKQRFVQEDPDERAARLALELTPWGVCNGCHSTIMMSDEVCLICNLPRGAPKPERLSRGSRSSADSLRDAPDESPPPVSPRKASMLTRMLHREGAEVEQSASPPKASPSDAAVDAEPKRGGLLRRKTGDAESATVEPDAASPRKPGGLMGLLARKAPPKTDEDVTEADVPADDELRRSTGGLKETFRGRKNRAAPSPAGTPELPTTEERKSTGGILDKLRSPRDASADAPEDAETTPRSNRLFSTLRSPRKTPSNTDQSSASVFRAADDTADAKGSPPPLPPKPSSVPNESTRLPKEKDAAVPPPQRTSSKLLDRLRVGRSGSDDKPAAASKPASSGTGLNLAAHWKKLFGGTPKAEQKPKESRVHFDSAAPAVVQKRTVQSEPATTVTVLAKQRPTRPAPRPPTSTASAPPTPAPVEPAPTGQACHVCRKPIVQGEPVVDMSDKGGEVYHARCWVCVYCKTPLRKYWRVEGAPVCETCFVDRDVSTRLQCSVCKQAVTEYFRVGNAIFCPSDFEKQQVANRMRCDVCATPLESYYSHNGKMLCEKDYLDIALKKCAICHAGMRTWYVYEGQQICEADYAKERAKKALRCSVCNCEVLQYTELGGKVYCPVDRPRCCDCSETLTRYVERDKKLLCLACAKRAQDAEDRKREIASPRSGSKSKEPSLVERAKRSLADEARKNEEPPVPPRSAASSRTAVKCVSCIINAEIKPGTPYYRVGDKIYCERHKPKPAPESSPSGPSMLAKAKDMLSAATSGSSSGGGGGGEKPPRCKSCRRDIDGAYVKFEGKPFHESCFRCSACKCVLGARFMKRDGKPVCSDCANK